VTNKDGERQNVGICILHDVHIIVANYHHQVQSIDMKKKYIVPETERIPVRIESMMVTMSGETSSYDGSNPRPIPTGESHDEDGDGNDDEEVTAKRWSGGWWEWD
jgi:hypothetical protein